MWRAEPKDRFIVYQAEQIDKLKAALEDSRRSGKRQAAQFSKGDPEADPKTPGRKRGDRHGGHGHRMAPAAPPDRELTVGLPPPSRASTSSTASQNEPGAPTPAWASSSAAEH